MKKLYKNWPVHNILGHPLMQIFNSLGLHAAAIMVHDGTLPQQDDHGTHESLKNNKTGFRSNDNGVDSGAQQGRRCDRAHANE